MSQILIPFYLGSSKPFWIWSISNLHEPCSGTWTHHRWLKEGLLFLGFSLSFFFFVSLPFHFLQKATNNAFFLLETSRFYRGSITEEIGIWGMPQGETANGLPEPEYLVSSMLIFSAPALASGAATLFSYASSSNQT